jgi:hypothetical protein
MLRISLHCLNLMILEHEHHYELTHQCCCFNQNRNLLRNSVQSRPNSHCVLHSKNLIVGGCIRPLGLALIDDTQVVSAITTVMLKIDALSVLITTRYVVKQ